MGLSAEHTVIAKSREEWRLRRLWLWAWAGRPAHSFLIVVTLATAALMAVPLLYIVVRAGQAGAVEWARLWQTRIPLLLANSLKLAASVTVLALLMGVPLAWLTVRTDLPGGRWFRWMGALPMVYPSFIGAFAYITVFGKRGLLEELVSRLLQIPVRDVVLPNIYGLGGTAVVMALFTYPYLYMLVAGALRNLNPSMEEAARSAGLRPLTIFWRVVLPMLRPAIGAGALLVAFHTLAEFGTVAMLRYETFTSAIYLQLVGRYNRAAAAALSVVLMLLTLALVVAESYWRRKARYYQTGGSWRPPKLVQLGRWRYPALLFALLVVLLSVALPGGLLLYWSYKGLSEGAASGLWGYAWNSLSSAGLGATLATLLAFPLGYLAARHNSPLGRALYQLSFSGYALPGVVVALAIIVLFNSYLPGLYGTIWILVAGYLVRFLPEALSAHQAALAQISPNVEEAARTCGHSIWSTLRRITLPLALPGIVSGWSLVFLNSLKELPATLLLRPAGYDTLAVRHWIYAAEGFYSQGGLPGLLLVLMALPPLILLINRVLRERAG